MISICYFCILLHGKSHLPSSALLSRVPCCLYLFTELLENCQKHQPSKTTRILNRTLSHLQCSQTQSGTQLKAATAPCSAAGSHIPAALHLPNETVALSHSLQSWALLCPHSHTHTHTHARTHTQTHTHTSLSQSAPAFLRGACCEPSQETHRTKEGLSLLGRGFHLSPHRQRPAASECGSLASWKVQQGPI